MANLVDVLDIFNFFLFLGGGKGGGARGGGRGGGGPVLIKIEGRGGGLSDEEAREREGRRGNVCGEGWVAKYFFFGAEMHTKPKKC